MINETLLLEIVGPDFLQYVLNASTSQITEHFRGTSLDEPRTAALNEIATVLGQLVPDPAADPMMWRMSLAALAQPVGEHRVSYANTLRARCGGSIAAKDPEDSVEKIVAHMSRDLYPLWLLPAGREPHAFTYSPPISGVLFRHPEHESLEAAVMADASLKKLFPDENSTLGRHGNYRSSIGRGGGVQLSMFAESMMRGSWQRIVMNGSQPTLNEFVDAVTASVNFMRNAAERSPVTVPVRAGLTGVKLPDDTPMEFPWGRLRPAREADRQGLPDSVSGSLSTTNAEGESVVIDYSGDVVLEMEIPYRLRIGDIDQTTEWPSDFRDFELLQRRIEAIQLGLMLAVDTDPLPMVVLAWNRILDPLNPSSGMGWSDTKRTPNLVQRQLTADERDSWATWITDVDDNRVPSIEVAIRRTIRAATERSDPSDSLVDAIIAWENLVGSRRGEPTLRISAALAWLLESTGPARRTRQAAIKKLYEDRSDIVHGNRPLDPREAWTKSREARQIAVDALKTLLRDRPELLRDCRSGDERSLKLILNDDE